MIEINGMAHVILTVSSFERALKFYGQLLPFLGLKPIFEGENFAYWVGGRTALGIQRCDDAHRGESFVQTRVGLHHLCFRARSREDIETAAEFLRESARQSFGDRSREIGRPGTIMCCSKIPTGSVSRFATCRARACLRRTPSSCRAPITHKRGRPMRGGMLPAGGDYSSSSPGSPSSKNMPRLHTPN